MVRPSMIQSMLSFQEMNGLHLQVSEEDGFHSNFHFGIRVVGDRVNGRCEWCKITVFGGVGQELIVLFLWAGCFMFRNRIPGFVARRVVIFWQVSVPVRFRYPSIDRDQRPTSCTYSGAETYLIFPLFLRFCRSALVSLTNGLGWE